MTLTKSSLQKQITDLEATRDEIPFGLDEDGNNTLAALKLALAGMEAEPVAEVYQPPNIGICAALGVSIRMLKPLNEGDKLYTAPQPSPPLENYRNAQQVVPDIDSMRLIFEAVERESDDGFNLHKYGIGYADEATQKRWQSWLSCRAAMLQGAENAESRCTIQTAPALDSSPKIAESRCSNAQAVPDGWVACSERMPDVGDVVLTAKDGFVNVGEMERSGANYRFFTSIASGRELPATHWQPLPAAPQQEADNV